MTSPKQIQIADYNYALPDERIAKFPVKQRDQSRLLVYRSGKISDTRFCQLPDYLPKDSLMVFNNTRVIQARLHFRKTSGALIEVFLLEPAAPADYELVFQTREQCRWHCLVGNLKKWKEGVLSRHLRVAGAEICLMASLLNYGENGGEVLLSWDNPDVSFADILDAAGELPIPPYLNRGTEESDKTTYQTVYSKIKGSVAAPTAGLHFTPDVLAAIDHRGLRREEVTLHVGAGTFRPVKSQLIEGHTMHTEFFSVTRGTVQQLIAHGAEAIAVGTTTVRTLESLYYIGRRLLLSDSPLHETVMPHVSQWEPYEGCSQPQPSALEALGAVLKFLDDNHQKVLHGSTQIIIAPGYDYKIVKALVTNFHQPQSTLLLLVSAFLGGERWRTVYDYALSHDFRFLSYGDSSLLIP